MVESHLKAEAAGHGTGVARLRDHIRNKRTGENGGHLGHASVSIDLNGFPKGTRTSASASGLFKETRLNRGRAMPMASQET
jgi:hypothetical protein